jgi:hypothetical protein
MDAAASSGAKFTSYKVDIRDKPGLYTRVEFVMEHPPLEERRPGTLYFAPDKEGLTRRELNRLNELIASDSGIVLPEGLRYPLTLEDVVGNYEGVKAVFNHMSAEQLLYFYGILDELPPVSGTEKTTASPQSEKDS